MAKDKRQQGSKSVRRKNTHKAVVAQLCHIRCWMRNYFFRVRNRVLSFQVTMQWISNNSAVTRRTTSKVLCCFCNFVPKHSAIKENNSESVSKCDKLHIAKFTIFPLNAISLLNKLKCDLWRWNIPKICPILFLWGGKLDIFRIFRANK